VIEFQLFRFVYLIVVFIKLLATTLNKS